MTTIYKEITDDLHRLGYDFRVNDLDDTLEIKTKNAGFGPMTDFIEDTLKIDMRELGYGKKTKPGITTMLEAVSKLANNQRYNPIKDYFVSVRETYKPGDNGPYIIYNCTMHFTNPDGYFGQWLFRWMVGAVAKVFTGTRNPMLVLTGEQRIGKSTFAEWLCPFPDRFVRGKINADDKDHRMRQATNFIWEADELGSTTRRADADELKSFLTLSEVYERPPFKKYPIRKPVTASFIGTANFDGSGLLNDPTGTSRFLTCEVNHIDFNYDKMSVNDLWAEASWYYANVPGSWKLTAEQEAAQAKINADYEITSALADTVEALFEMEPDSTEFVSTQEIKRTIALHYRISNEQSFFNELARVLTKFGLQKGRESMGGKRGWIGLRPKL